MDKIIMMSTPRDIKIALIERGTSGAAVARSLGVDRTMVYHVIAGRAKSPRVREAIARAVGKKVSDLWPPEEMDKS